MNDDRTLVAVFDSAHVRFFEYKANGKLVSILHDVSSGLHHDRREIEADRPGRTISAGGEHHAFESHHDPRKLEKHDFVRALAMAIDEALERHAFGRLAIAAPSRSIGEFRSVASPKVLKSLWREVPKELANLSEAELEAHLLPVLQSLSE
jgi:protein required for attachment to host cells